MYLHIYIYIYIFGHMPFKTGPTVLRVQHRNVAANGYDIIYNIDSPESNEYKNGDPPCRGLAPRTDADHQFCTIIVFRAGYVIYLYIYIYIYMYMYIYCRVVGEVSRWMVLKILNHGINETLPYIYIYMYIYIYIYTRVYARQGGPAYEDFAT